MKKRRFCLVFLRFSREKGEVVHFQPRQLPERERERSVLESSNSFPFVKIVFRSIFARDRIEREEEKEKGEQEGGKSMNVFL